MSLQGCWLPAAAESNLDARSGRTVTIGGLKFGWRATHLGLKNHDTEWGYMQAAANDWRRHGVFVILSLQQVAVSGVIQCFSVFLSVFVGVCNICFRSIKAG